jgi:hypothetical protein
MTNTNTQAKDLTKVAPRSAYDTSLGGFAILARAIDKGRATIAGTNGDFNFDCPVDNMLLSFKGVKGEALKAELAAGKTDEEVTEWFKANGLPKTDEEIKAWSDAFHSDFSYAHHPDAGKQAWFRGECTRLGLDADKTTLFDMLDADDKVHEGNSGPAVCEI